MLSPNCAHPRPVWFKVQNLYKVISNWCKTLYLAKMRILLGADFSLLNRSWDAWITLHSPISIEQLLLSTSVRDTSLILFQWSPFFAGIYINGISVMGIYINGISWPSSLQAFPLWAESGSSSILLQTSLPASGSNHSSGDDNWWQFLTTSHLHLQGSSDLSQGLRQQCRELPYKMRLKFATLPPYILYCLHQHFPTNCNLGGGGCILQLLMSLSFFSICFVRKLFFCSSSILCTFASKSTSSSGFSCIEWHQWIRSPSSLPYINRIIPEYTFCTCTFWRLVR